MLKPTMNRSMILAITLLLSATLVAAETADTLQAIPTPPAPEGEVVLDHAEALLLEMFSEITPIGEPTTTVQDFGEGQQLVVTRQTIKIETAFGAVAGGTVTCTHLGCNDPDCLVEGCDPQELPSGHWGCTGPGCIKSQRNPNACSNSTPKGCQKIVSIQTQF